MKHRGLTYFVALCFDVVFQFELDAEQIRLSAQVELENEKKLHREQVEGLRAELKKWRGIKKVLKDQYKGEVKLLRRRIDDLEEELEGWRNSHHFRAKKNGKSAYDFISDVDSSRTLYTNSEPNDSRRRLIVDDDDKDVTCRVNWGFLFGRKRNI